MATGTTQKEGSSMLKISKRYVEVQALHASVLDRVSQRDGDALIESIRAQLPIHAVTGGVDPKVGDVNASFDLACTCAARSWYWWLGWESQGVVKPEFNTTTRSQGINPDLVNKIMGLLMISMDDKASKATLVKGLQRYLSRDMLELRDGYLASRPFIWGIGMHTQWVKSVCPNKSFHFVFVEKVDIQSIVQETKLAGAQFNA